MVGIVSILMAGFFIAALAGCVLLLHRMVGLSFGMACLVGIPLGNVFVLLAVALLSKFNKKP